MGVCENYSMLKSFIVRLFSLSALSLLTACGLMQPQSQTSKVRPQVADFPVRPSEPVVPVDSPTLRASAPANAAPVAVETKKQEPREQNPVQAKATPSKPKVAAPLGQEKQATGSSLQTQKTPREPYVARSLVPLKDEVKQAQAAAPASTGASKPVAQVVAAKKQVVHARVEDSTGVHMVAKGVRCSTAKIVGVKEKLLVNCSNRSGRDQRVFVDVSAFGYGGIPTIEEIKRGYLIENNKTSTVFTLTEIIGPPSVKLIVRSEEV